MATLRIYDLDRGTLAVDLRHFIALLVPSSLQATWTVSPVKLFCTERDSFEEEFEATGQGGEELEALARDRSRINGAVLAELANATVQVIWGEFAATLQRQGDIWLTIRAIDSTFYEVTTEDTTVLDAIRSTFKDVRVAAGPVTSTSIPQLPPVSHED
jgi:hypothetical protein